MNNSIERARNLLSTARLDRDDAMAELKAKRTLSFEKYEGFRGDVSMLEDAAQKLQAIIDSARTNGSNLPLEAIEDRVRSVLKLKQELEFFIDDVTPYVRIIDLCGALESIEAADTVPELERMFCN
jgi:hypothetical protein